MKEIYNLLYIFTLQFMIGWTAGQLNSTTDTNVRKFVAQAVTFTANYDRIQTTAVEIVNWRFSGVDVARLIILIDGSYSNFTLSSVYRTRLQFWTEKPSSTYLMTLTFSTLSLTDNGIVVDVSRTTPNAANTGIVSTLSVIDFENGAANEVTSGVVGESVTLDASYARSQSIEDEIIQWRFSEFPVAILQINADGTTSKSMPSTEYSSILDFSHGRSGVLYTMNLTILSLNISLDGTVVDVYRSTPTTKVLGNITTLMMSETATTAPTTQAATTTMSSYSSTDSTPDTTSIDPDPLPGWAIFLIVLAALVVVFAVLFMVWWFVKAFRECLHGVSECFPEEHCCGKGSKDINEETTQKAAQVEDDL